MRRSGPWRPAAVVAPLRARAFHASAARCEEDLYQVLELQRGASKAQIKNQFYKLSKKYHPDVSKSEEGKQLFQRVSEAYATLGNDRKRREYDQQLAVRSHSAGASASAPAYDPGENMRRRATANYAWAYRQRTAKTHTSDYAPKPPPESPGNASHLFTKMAERESRREFARQKAGTSGVYGNPDTFRVWSQKRWSQEEHQAEMMSPFLRFVQVAAVMGGAVWLSNKLLS